MKNEVGWLTPGNLQDCLSPTLSFSWLPVSRASYLFHRGSQSGKEDQEGIYLLPQAETCPHSSLSPSCLWESIGDPPSASWSAVGCHPASGLVQSSSSSQSFSDALVVLNLSTSCWSCTTRLSRTSTCSHLTQVLSLLPFHTNYICKKYIHKK